MARRTKKVLAGKIRLEEKMSENPRQGFYPSGVVYLARVPLWPRPLELTNNVYVVIFNGGTQVHFHS
jgi:hypothetical protein